MLSFTNSPGNIFNRFGKCALIIKALSSYQTSQKTNLIDTTNGVMAQFVTEQDIQALVGNAYISQVNSPDAVCGFIGQIAEQGLNRAIFRDNPRLSQNLSQLNTLASLQELIRQMKLANANVLAMTITATPQTSSSPGPNFTGSGTGVLNASVKRPLDGLVLENSFAETLLLVCTSDSYTGGQTAGNETFALTGTGQETDVFAFDWPLGSNASTSLSAIDGDANQTSGNLLNKSNFATWTAGIPDQWTVPVGPASIQQNGSITYGSGQSVQIIGDGATLTELRQAFNSSAGNTSTLTPLTQYGVCLFFRRDGTAANTGLLAVDIIDGNGVTILDANSVPNTFNIDPTAFTTSFTQYLGAFRTPAILPASYSFRVRLTTPLTNGRSVYMAKISDGLMTQAYTSGPFASIHAGNTPFVAGDYSGLVVTNSRGAGGTLNTFQTACARMFSQFIQNELLLPSSSSPTLSDSTLIA